MSEFSGRVMAMLDHYNNQVKKRIIDENEMKYDYKGSI